MQQCVNHFSGACDNFGFTISTKKTEVMHQPAPRKMYHEPHIFANDEPLKATDSFTYLGSTLSREVNIYVEVNNRLSKANSAFGRLRKKVLDRRGISQAKCIQSSWLCCEPSCHSMHASHGLCTAVTPENSTTSIQP